MYKLNGEWILNDTKNEGHNCIDITHADENIQTEYLLIKESIISQVTETFKLLVEDLQSHMNKLN